MRQVVRVPLLHLASRGHLLIARCLPHGTVRHVCGRKHQGILLCPTGTRARRSHGGHVLVAEEPLELRIVALLQSKLVLVHHVLPVVHDGRLNHRAGSTERIDVFKLVLHSVVLLSRDT